MRCLTTGFAALIAAAFSVSAAGAETYMRPGKKAPEAIEVKIIDGQLWCTRVSDGYEMCNGMRQGDDERWRGGNMRHPGMPKFMKFNGTVSFHDGSLNIKGCALGICDAENWTKKKAAN